MEILPVELDEVLHIEKNEVKVIARLQKASDESHPIDVLLLLQEMDIFIF